MGIVRGIVGISIFIGIAYLLSENRQKINWNLVIVGLTLQVLFGVLITQIDAISFAFQRISKAFVTLINFSKDGAIFLFAGLARNSFEDPNAHHELGVIFAFQVLPAIVFFSTFSAGLYYLGILQKIVYAIAWVMSKTMKLSGAESLAAAGNIFLGQTEAPLLVKPFIPRMTKSELMCLMTGGMATIAGSVLASFVKFLANGDPQQEVIFASHLLSASFMNAPAGIILSKIIIPETEFEKIDRALKVNKENLGVNLIDALSTGASEGLKLALNVGGMLLAFIALIAFCNYVFQDLLGNWLIWNNTTLNEYIRQHTNQVFSGFTLQYVLGQFFRIFAWLMGVDWQDTLLVGSMLGQKTVINEFVAYMELAKYRPMNVLSEKSVLVCTYALCGFSNFSSIAIQVGGIGSMAPEKQGLLSQLGLKALIAATLACMMTATIAGMITYL
ncbi:MAG: NupC/NupG family nucleoside CNT transporter [Cytophagales bacterium]|nr:NupC/NupG family nucleoside CNT transporter [Cytophagales bacterium]MDW8385291.1 nucleoside transporter C-terminal domain-containing protein [Flammeovirgaceae bacterium]